MVDNPRIEGKLHARTGEAGVGGLHRSAIFYLLWGSMPAMPVIPRPLTDEERRLAHWMLEKGGPTAQPFLAQLDRATATTWRCKCGCASFNLLVTGLPPAPPGIEILADFIFGSEGNLKGIFIYEKGGILSGVELTGYDGEAPSVLPSISELR